MLFILNTKDILAQQAFNPTNIMASKINQYMSISLPHMDARSFPPFEGIDADRETSAKDFIAKQFFDKHIGEVAHIDFVVSKKTSDGYTFYSADVRFSLWYDNHYSRTIQGDIYKCEWAKFQFHKDWHWIVMENLSVSHESKISRLEVIVRYQQEEIKKLTESLEHLAAEHANKSYIKLSSEPHTYDYGDFEVKSCPCEHCQASGTIDGNVCDYSNGDGYLYPPTTRPTMVRNN